MNTIMKLTSVALLAMSATSASAATFSIFTDRTAFEAALSNVFVYDFDAGAPSSGVSIFGDDVSYSSGVLEDIIDRDAALDTLFAFDSAIFGFGGDFDLVGPGGLGSGIEVAAAGSDIWAVGEIPETTSGSFFGFISDVAFTSVRFSEGTGSGFRESYTLDNLTTGMAPVPVPAAGLLLLGGLGAIGGLSWRRKRKAAAA